ncbi:polyketide synthase [Bipolaris maydis]|nr:polyketide synthase [Bipolaris maydis]KAJ5057361.1 polyketide synthase [Bipolaris maydis]KAJ6194109.1 polyketide synthase [Bipolaris maydis]
MNKIHIDNVVDDIVETLDLPSVSQQQQSLFAFRNSVILRTMMKNVENKCDGRITFTQRDLIKWTKRDESEAETPMSPKGSKLAVVGMSCRLPGGANDLELFWKLMVDKRDVHTMIPPDRFELSTHFDPTGQIQNTTQTSYMNHIDSPGLFDAGFFNISPKEAEQMDPMHRLALVTVYEALEMSGYSPNRTRSTSSPRVGTYHGQASDDWRELNASQNIGTYAVPSGERGFANGRINYFFKFNGPSFNMDTAYSSGLAAVNAACSALWAGDVDIAIAGGLNVITDPDNSVSSERVTFCLLRDNANVVIKRLDDALADNDKILATILAANTNHSADAISITHPHAPKQAQNYQRVMSQAGFSPLDVSYVELHGTGTQAGDREEAKSVSHIFAPVAPRRKKKYRLRLGAVKSNIGHGGVAAGIASFIKVLLMYQKSAIPPQIGVKKLNPTLPPDLEERTIGLNWEYVEWPRPKTGSRLAIVNSFGAHGGNTTVLLSDGPVPSPVITDPRPSFPLTISARSKNSLKMNTETLLQYINDHEDAQLGDLSYTLTARRIHHPFRLATSVKDISQANKFLSIEIEKMEQQQWVSTVPLKAPTVAFTFTGQGAFYVGMCSQLYSHCSSFREDVQRLDRLSQSFNLGFDSAIPIIDGAAGYSDTVDPVASQLAIVLVELALAHYWATLGIKPSMVMGHSSGEFAALAVAGVISELDALYLTTARAKLMAKHCQVGTDTMLAVRCSIDRLEELLAGREQDYELACINGESDLVISGAKTQIQDLASILATAGLKSTALNVPYAFHSVQMDPILESFAQLAENVTFKAPQIPVVSPLLAECIFDGKTLNHEYLRRATREQVEVVGALDAAQELGIADADTVWIDIGPHMIAGGMVRNILTPNIVVPSVKRDEDNFSTLVSSLVTLHRAGVTPVWNKYFREHERAHQVFHLPTYRWNDKTYWIPYLGTWTLDKAHIKENLDKARQNKALSGISGMGSKLKTSTIHSIVSETVGESTVSLVTLSDLLDHAFLEAVEGHRMNNHGVASSSIWADMAFTVGRYLHGLGYPKEKDFHMNVRDMEILYTQVARSRKDGPQLIQLEATLDIHARSVTIFLYNVSQDGIRDAKYYGSCKIQFEEAATWSKNWKRLEHLVRQRIQALDQLAIEGLASKINRNMAYTLFKNVVTYADHYRGMRSVVLKDYEAFADVTLNPDELGFILNGSDASNTDDFFYVTPGWETFRLARPPHPGASCRSYVQMVSSEEDPKFWTGDVYILQGDTIIGMIGQMKFRQINRILMDRFFSPSEIHGTAHASSTSSKVKTIVPAAAGPVAKRTTPTIVHPAPVSVTAEKAEPANEENSLIAGAIDLILKETGVDASELKDDTTFMQIGVDSLMSLVLVEKFKNILKMEIKSSLFIECETVGVFKEWLEENQ